MTNNPAARFPAPRKKIMIESEYLKVENLTRIHAASEILSRVLPDYGVEQEEMREIMARLEEIGTRLRASIVLEEDPE